MGEKRQFLIKQLYSHTQLKFMKSVPGTTENFIVVVFSVGPNRVNHGVSNDKFTWFSAGL